MTSILDDILSDLKSLSPVEHWRDLIHSLKVSLGLSDPRVEVTLALVLVDIATIDDNFDNREKELITQFLCKMFEISEQQALDLITKANQQLRAGTNLDKLKKVLKKNFSYKERAIIVSKMADILRSDGVAHPFEVDLHSRYAELLGVPIKRPKI